MERTLFVGPILFAAVCCGLVAGIFFAFSVFVMRALASIREPAGIAAMQAINLAVLHPWFLMVLTWPAVVCPLVAFLSAFVPSGIRPWLGLAASVLYLVGVIGVTVVFNLPLNRRLAAVDPDSAEGAEIWRDYVLHWTAWNHVRAAAAAAAMILLILAAI